MFILLSDTCIKNKLTRDYRAKLHPGTFQKYRLFLYLYVGGGGKNTPFVYTFEVHVPVLFSSAQLSSKGPGNRNGAPSLARKSTASLGARNDSCVFHFDGAMLLSTIKRRSRE
jgi:hypothetical protein